MSIDTAKNAGGWYADPLYYDIIFDQDTAIEADFIEGAWRRHGGKKTAPLKVLEPACGSGRLLLELARRGHQVTGFDLEPAMLEFARQRLDGEGLQGRLEPGRMEGFDLRGSHDLAHCFVSTFKYILGERGARAHLRCVARHLHKGGIYLLGFHLTDYANGDAQREKWKGARGAVRVDCTIDSDPPDSQQRFEKVRSYLAIREGKRRRDLRTEWDFRTYDADQVRAMLRAVPEFSLEACYDFRYDLGESRELNDEWEDIVLVLKKR